MPGSLVGVLMFAVLLMVDVHARLVSGMRARNLAAEYPTVGLETDAREAARLLASQNLPGLIVVDAEGRPHSILAGTQVLRFAVPGYVQDDPKLAAVIDEDSADAFCLTLAGIPVRDLLPTAKRELPVVNGDDTVLEIAAIMARTRTPVIAVVEKGRMLGAVTLDALLDRMLPS
ncbi:MAG TPA: CBS domain-containing protein [Cryptosporangiaceae bacterium]|nr:CBS domain-containing protein [Cryptosporangiaceae bacterium]